MQRRVISLIVSNNPGVLCRIAGLISRRGYNIESITVGTTVDTHLSRITIVVMADESKLEQVIKQLDKLIDVKKIIEVPNEMGSFREIALVKVHSDDGNRMDVMNIVNKYNGTVIDIGSSTATVQLTGTCEYIDTAITELKEFGVIEIARTGMVALERGDKKLYEI